MSDRDPKLWAALAYSLGLVSGLIVLSIEKKDTFVRFHAMQSVLAFTVAALMSMLIPTLPILGGWRLMQGLFRLSVVVLWIFLIVKALQGEQYRLTYLGDIASSLETSTRSMGN